MQDTLQVREYLQSGKSLANLTDELGIKIVFHPSLPLVALNYDQIESPKTHPIVRECRGLVLHRETFDLVARSFPRFFNWGEVADEMPLFDFQNFVVDSKEDGSLCMLYHFNGEWHGNTRGSFGMENMPFQEFSWRDGFLRAMGVSSWQELDTILDRDLTYICEFVSPWNEVVRRYPQPQMYLLAVFRGVQELNWTELDTLTVPFIQPERLAYHSIDAIVKYLETRADSDKTFEGVVIRDINNRRWKVKTPTYLALHRMRGKGDNLSDPNNLIPFVLASEGDELLAYFPEVAATFTAMKEKVEDAYATLETVWHESKDIENQKDFAMAIVKRTPFNGILFDLRKRFGKEQTLEMLKNSWRSAGDLIIKILFKS
jgi:RNA ligase